MKGVIHVGAGFADRYQEFIDAGFDTILLIEAFPHKVLAMQRIIKKTLTENKPAPVIMCAYVSEKSNGSAVSLRHLLYKNKLEGKYEKLVISGYNSLDILKGCGVQLLEKLQTITCRAFEKEIYPGCELVWGIDSLVSKYGFHRDSFYGYATYIK